MTGFGVLLIILGVGSLLLPMLNLQFRLMEIVDPYQPWAGIFVTVIGAALVAFGMQRSRAAVVTTSSTTAPAPAAPAPAAPEAPAAPAAQAVPPPVDTPAPDAAEATAAAADADRDQA